MTCSLLAGCGAANQPAAPAADASGEKFYIYSWNTELQDRLEYVFEVYPELRDQVVYVNSLMARSSK